MFPICVSSLADAVAEKKSFVDLVTKLLEPGTFLGDIGRVSGIISDYMILRAFLDSYSYVGIVYC